MKIALLTYGTRGDVQPYAVLGQHLAQRGHEVTISACTNLASMTGQAGLRTVPIPIDSLEFFRSEEGRSILAAGKTTRFLKELGRRETQQRAALDGALIQASAGADVVVSSVLTASRAPSLTEAAGQRLLLVYTLPVEPTRAYPCPYLLPGRDVPSGLARKWSHQAFEAVFWRGARANVAALRQRLGLPPSGRSAFAELRGRQVPVMHLVSPQLLAGPADWPGHLRNVGAPVVPAGLRAAWGEDLVAPDLRAWLGQGDAPVFFGFGSMPVPDPVAAVAMIDDVAGRLGVRALIGAGWSGFAAGTGSGRTFVADHFDHDQVLPTCRAAVHHGGAGTTHAVLRAGLPAVVAHVFADQSLWGRCVQQAGAGRTLPCRQLSAGRLAEELRPLLRAGAKARAEQLGQAMAAEQPLAELTRAIESGETARAIA